MTDLSTPPENARRGEPTRATSDTRLAREVPIAWPAPPVAGYPAVGAGLADMPCELIGPTGTVTRVTLLAFDPARGAASVLPPQMRRPLDLRFDQFQRLTLLSPLWPLEAPRRPAATAQPFRAVLKTGLVVEGLSHGPVDDPAGCFLFEPEGAGDGGALRCSFIPRAALARLAVGSERAGVEATLSSFDHLRNLSSGRADVPAAQAPQARAETVARIMQEEPAATEEALDEAIELQARMPLVRLGEALVGLDLINEEQLAATIAEQRGQRGVALGELLVRKGLVSRTDLQTALARKMGYPVVDLAKFRPTREALALVNKAMALRLQAMPLMLRRGRIVVAVEDPSRAAAMEEIEFAAGMKAVPVLGPAAMLTDAIERAYQRLLSEKREARQAEADRGLAERGGQYGGAAELLATMERDFDASDADADAGAEQAADSSLVRLINSFILDAQAQGASDIHIETQPGRDKVRVRFRRDGLLKPYMELPHTYRSAMLARLKIMCDLDISEKRKPQDGKISFGKFVPGSSLELRVATIPTANGLEDAVLRLLSGARLIPLHQLGLSPANLERVQSIIGRPYGMFLCVGPTGSGKTTTLHSALGAINGPERKIWTAEDPIEITQAGLRQVQVNPRIGWTFANALRAFLRADPDVIMVGEIRDKETAQVAIESSLTGHLVLSTLHTNSAPETVTRLLDIGMDPFNFGDSLLGVLSQRLVRQICPHCRTSREATQEEIDELIGDYRSAFAGSQAPAAATLHAQWIARFGRRRDDHSQADTSGNGVLLHHDNPGCDRCAGTGFRGRIGVHELLTVDRQLRQMIQTGARVDDIQRAAIEAGMRTLRQDGIEKVLAGDTTIGEVRATTNA